MGAERVGSGAPRARQAVRERVPGRLAGEAARKLARPKDNLV